MKKLYSYFKMLLALVGVVAATQVNAATKTYDFQTYAKTLSGNVTVSGGEAVSIAGVPSTVFIDQAGFAFDGRFAGQGTWLVQRNTGLYSSNGGGRKFAVLNLKKGDKVTFVKNDIAVTFSSTNAAKEGVAVTSGEAIESGATYEVTADGMLAFDATRYVVFNSITIETAASETVTAPKIEVVGANGGDRIVQITPGVSDAGNEVTTYYTTDGTEPTASSTKYTAPITVSATATVKAVTISSESTVSDVASLEVTAGEALTLNAPEIQVNSVSEIAGLYHLTFGASSDNSTVLGKPAATITATFAGEDVSSDITAGTFAPTKYGVLEVTASATGYTSATVSLTISNKYEQTWRSLDYSAIADDDVIATLGDSWSKQAGTGRWSSWANGEYTYYQHGAGGAANMTIDTNLRMREVIILNVGFGLSRNVSGTENVNFLNTKEGEVAAITIYNGYGKAVEGNTYVSYRVNTGSGIAPLGCNNGTVLVQAAYYSPVNVPDVVTKTITAAGYATFSSANALDFSGVEGLTAYIAKVSGNAVTFEAVTTVPANTGVLLKGDAKTYEIPVVASAAAVEGNAFVAAVEETVAPAGSFVLLATPSVGFYKAKADFTAGAGTAYLPATASARPFIGFDDEATGIRSVVSSSTADDKAFNLQGQRVAQPTKGLYIVGGKKVVKR